MGSCLPYRPYSSTPSNTAFPIDLLKPVLKNVRRIVVAEASNGQLEDELRLALSKADIHPPPIVHQRGLHRHHLPHCGRHFGGILPQQGEIVERVLQGEEVAP
ncbi:hypothetical protein ACFL0I_05360 [Gemmatimonadota bacterium]